MTEQCQYSRGSGCPVCRESQVLFTWKVQASCVIEAVQAQKLKLLCKRLFTIGAGVWSLGEFAEKQNQPGSPVE